MADGYCVLHDAVRDRWLRFDRPRRVLAACTLAEVVPCLCQVEEETARHGLCAAGFISYEAAPALDSALRVRAEPRFPLLWFGLYDEPEEIPDPSRLSEQDAGPPAPKPDLVWEPSISRDRYLRSVERIRSLIAAGHTYQVNFTYFLRAAFSGSSWDLFLRLARAQENAYGAYIETERWAICSSSPELLFSLAGDAIESRPMKGTAPRGLWYAQDLERAEMLMRSDKDRAENVMIVDMVRNDLGRVAKAGTVEVPVLFQAERYPTVWQLTSTVRAETTASLDQIFCAVFPPASTTGAPKPKTTEIIAALEAEPRRIYTGAIGFALPGRRAQFNVAIRTALVDKERRQAEYGVGGGIVWDSVPEAELAESRLKSRVLHLRQPRFELLETIRWEPPDGYFLLPYHLRRLGESAEYFGFRLSVSQLRAKLTSAAGAFPPAPQRIRLLVSRTGEIEVTAHAIEKGEQAFGGVALARSPIDPGSPFLYHKTTCRDTYERALDGGQSDALLYNRKGQVTESTIANIVVEIDGGLWTPPVECGLLPGTYRAWLLDRQEIRERIITLDDLRQASGVYLINSVRGMQRIDLRIPGSGIRDGPGAC
jgi:para-aminobenzoate synthetase / 4-amino-4-deoxychorismate lyase